MRFVDDLHIICLVLLMTSLASPAPQSSLLPEARPSPLTSEETLCPFTSDGAAPPPSVDEAFLNLTKRLDELVKVDTRQCLTVGEELRLSCRLDEELLHNFTARDISFRQTHPLQVIGREFRCFSSPNVRVVNTTAAILTVRNVSLDDSGQFSCFVGDGVCHKGQGLMRVKLVGYAMDVLVEYPLQNVTNFHCVVHNWDSMTCTWTHPVEYVDMSRVNVTSSYSLHSSGTYTPCPALSFTSCLWDESTFRPSIGIYSVQVSVTNTCATTSTSKTFTVSPLDSVKPDPVEKLTAVKSATEAGCLILSWKHSKPDRDKVYRIKHQIAGDKTFEVLVDNLASKDTVINYVTCGYRPYTHHNLSVECLPAGMYTGYWSEPAYSDVWSAMAAPDLGPMTTYGSFTSTKCVDGLRNVTLMWQEVEESARNGLIDGYLVRHKESSIRNTTADEYSASVELPCNLPSELTIFAHNEAGYSLSPSVLVISARSFSVPIEVTKFFTAEVITSLNSSEDQLHLSWLVGEDTKNMDYTIFWCEDQVQACKSKINWRKVPSKQTSCDIQIPSSEAGKYLFGISITDVQTRMGSEIFWTDCLFSSNPSDIPAVQNLKVTSMAESILISWDEQLCISHRQIKFTNFTVKWGLTSEYERNNVAGTDWISDVKIPATKSSFVIDSLKANVNYSFTVQPTSFNVLGEEVQPWISASPLAADTPVSLAGVLGGLASGVFVLVVIFLVCRNCKTQRKKLQMLTNIRILDMSTINLETYKCSSNLVTQEMSVKEGHVTTAITACPSQTNEAEVMASPLRTVTSREPGALFWEESLKLGKAGMDFPATCTTHVDIVDGSSTLKHPSKDSSGTFPLVITSSDYFQQNICESYSDGTYQSELPQTIMEIQTKDSNGELHREAQNIPSFSHDESDDNLKTSLPSNCYIRLTENDDMKEMTTDLQLEDLIQSKCDSAYTDLGYMQSFLISTNILPNQIAELEPDNKTNLIMAGPSTQTLPSSPSNPLVHHEKVLTEDTETGTDKKCSIITMDLKENNIMLKSNLIDLKSTVSQYSLSTSGHISETFETGILSPDESCQVSEISSEQSNMDNDSCSTHDIAEYVAHMSETAEFSACTASTQSGDSKLSAGTASTQSGDSKLSAGTASTQSGDSKLSAGTASTQSGDSKPYIEYSAGTASTQSGDSKLSAGTASTQSGDSKPYIEYSAGTASTQSGDSKLSAGTASTQSGDSKTDNTSSIDYIPLPVDYIHLRELSNSKVDSS